MLKSYVKELSAIAQRGDAREESFYSTLETLLKEYASSSGKKKISITTLPKQTEAGNPDFRVWDGKQHIVGYIEAKAPSFGHTDSLDRIEKSDQLKRYRSTFPNLILTDFFEFRLYRDGNLTDQVRIGRPFVARDLKATVPVENEEAFLGLLGKFFSFSFPNVYSAKNLAIELAKRTRFLRDEVIIEELEEGSQLVGFYEAFKEYLISSLTKEDFADLYSQTITYGLFAARTRSENGFNRKLAYDNIPHTIGILRDVFRFISSGDLSVRMEWIIDDISEVLAVTDVNAILSKFFHEAKGKDPIVHFYETFLAEYDPKTREKRGVYYTPEPVVSYIVRSLHHILKEDFGKADGFADTSVTVLDPAAGTLTFLAEAARLAVEEFTAKYGEGKKSGFIKEHILKNFYAFELMMAPYAIGHLKMSFLLEELGYKLKGDDRTKLYLTNTLEMDELEKSKLPFMASLSEESRLAGAVKKDQPILVILGNPPYSGISINIGEWITNLIEDYKYVDGKHFGERKHWLQDDYVKFIRFSQWKIDQMGEGVLGFVTNHSYLDNPTFRGMRQSLMNTFNEIYILDLHGNSKKKEKCPDGSKDENVFDIQQGVAIALCIKTKSASRVTLSKAKDLKAKKSEDSSAEFTLSEANVPQNDKTMERKVYHSEQWGLREDKYDWLLENDLKITDWKKLTPNSPYYFFVPKGEKGREIYENYWQVCDIFPINVTGIVTARDGLVIDLDKESLKARIMIFRNKNLEDGEVKNNLKLKENYMWRVSKARKDLMAVKDWEDYFSKILYRPFDVRDIYFHDSVVWRTRKEVMRHMMQENLGLITNRQVNGEFRHAFCSDMMINDCTVSLETRERSYLFPLYLHSDTDKKDLFAHMESPQKRQPNISPNIFTALSKAYGTKPTPEEIFYYIYGVLYSNTYRTKYAEFLKSDFPRVPFTKDYKLFKNMGEYGKTLVDLHLLKSKDLDKPVAKFPISGSDVMEKLRYDDKAGRVYINKGQYFEGISPEVWEYQIGGYQVCEKWLKDRKDRPLSVDDTQHYCKVVTSLKKTIEIQKMIDEIYPNVEAETITFREGL